MTAVDVATATADDFQPRVNDVFSVRTRAGEIALTLAEVRRLGEALRKGGAFSVLFTAKDNLGLPQAIYAVSHPALGTLELFLVPIGPVPAGYGYEAVFT